jgi:hypothetical protein
MRFARPGALLLALVVALSVVPITSAVAAPPAPRPTANVTVRGPGGHKLGPDPVLRAGAAVDVTVRGLDASTLTQAILAPDGRSFAFPSSGNGVTHAHFVVPSGLRAGQHTLLFVAEVGHTTSDAASRSSVMRGGGTMTVIATVPHSGRFPFKTAPRGLGTAGASAGPHGGWWSGVTSRTGIDLLAMLAAALLALALGAGLTTVARRRRRRLPA